MLHTSTKTNANANSSSSKIGRELRSTRVNWLVLLAICFVAEAVGVVETVAVVFLTISSIDELTVMLEVVLV